MGLQISSVLLELISTKGITHLNQQIFDHHGLLALVVPTFRRNYMSSEDFDRMVEFDPRR
jgi:hypothetical protein